jgi:putative addiction module killer protein
MDIQQTEIFRNWFNGLKDRRARARILMRIDRAENGNFGDHKSVGGGVSEMRIDYGVGYRIYYALRGAQLVILLAGGDKSSQAQDIRTAQQLVRQL